MTLGKLMMSGQRQRNTYQKLKILLRLGKERGDNIPQGKKHYYELNERTKISKGNGWFKERHETTVK